MAKGNVIPFFTWRSAVLNSDLSAGAKYVALIISTHMNDHGEGAFPSQDRLARLASVDRKTIGRNSQALVDSGWIVRDNHGFRGQKWRSYEYKISFPAAVEDGQKGGDNMSQASKKVGTICPEGGDNMSQNVGAQCPSITPVNTSVNTIGTEQHNIYEQYEPSEKVKDVIRLRGVTIGDGWVAEYRVVAEGKEYPQNKLDQGFINFCKTEKVYTQNREGMTRAGTGSNQQDQEGPKKQQSEFVSDVPIKAITDETVK